MSSIAVEEYYSAFVSSKDSCFYPGEKGVTNLHAREGGNSGSPASGSAADTHSNVNTVLVKGPSVPPSESQSRSPFYLALSVILASHSLTSVSVVSGCSQLVTQESLVGCLYLQKAAAVVIQVDWEGKTDVA